MVVTCENCSSSLQLDDSKTPSGSFAIRCPKCASVVRVTRQTDEETSAASAASSAAAKTPAQSFELTAPAPAFRTKQESAPALPTDANEFLRLLATALRKESAPSNGDTLFDSEAQNYKILICVGSQIRQPLAENLADAEHQVFVAENPSQAIERLRDGDIRIVFLSPDFAHEISGAPILHRFIQSLPPAERRRHFYVAVEENIGTFSINEAFLRNQNLIINSRDVSTAAQILDRALKDFRTLYRHFSLGLKG